MAGCGIPRGWLRAQVGEGQEQSLCSRALVQLRQIEHCTVDQLTCHSNTHGTCLPSSASSSSCSRPSARPRFFVVSCFADAYMVRASMCAGSKSKRLSDAEPRRAQTNNHMQAEKWRRSPGMLSTHQLGIFASCRRRLCMLQSLSPTARAVCELQPGVCGAVMLLHTPFLQLASVSDRIALLFLGLDVRHMTQTAPPSCNSSALYAAAHSQNNTRVFALRSMWLSGCLRVPAGSTTQLPFYTPGRG